MGDEIETAESPSWLEHEEVDAAATEREEYQWWLLLQHGEDGLARLRQCEQEKRREAAAPRAAPDPDALEHERRLLEERRRRWEDE